MTIRGSPNAARMTVALVTCADTGAGLEIARELADRDMDVVLAARVETAAKRAAERLWDEGLDGVRPRALDPSSSTSVRKLRGRIGQDFGRLDVLVLCGLDDDERARVSGELAAVMGGEGRVVTVERGGVAAAVREASGS